MKDALEMQLGKKRASRRVLDEDDYAVLDGVLPQGAEVRTKKRKYCHGDKVPEANADAFMQATGLAGPVRVALRRRGWS